MGVWGIGAANSPEVHVYLAHGLVCFELAVLAYVAVQFFVQRCPFRTNVESSSHPA